MKRIFISLPRGALLALAVLVGCWLFFNQVTGMFNYSFVAASMVSALVWGGYIIFYWFFTALFKR